MDFLILCSLAPALVDLSAGWSGLGDNHPAAKTPRTGKNRLQKGTVMMLKRTASFALTTACLTAIATMSAHAQTAGPYGTTPGYTAPQGSAAYGTTPGYNSRQSSVPQANQSGVGQSASARRNVIESKQYDRAVETNRGFRQARMRKECGPITDPELRQSCLASFNREEAQTGSSTSSRSQGTGSGR